MVEQARELFAAKGYTPTTLEEIAAAAGVAVQTVYFHFGNKATVLKQVVDTLAVGDDEPIPVLDRPWVQQAREAVDGRQALAIWLGGSRTIFTRLAPIMKIVRDAAGSDPEMAAQWATNQQQRYIAHQALADLLADKHALRPQLTRRQAADIIYALISHEVFYLLTIERGWSPEQWQTWATETLATTLLA
ncbi:helix-turn-helix domain-containing protein [Nonomuraea jabiensis]|uniref:TetR/AcrR family transcriptional regulator n=1 Tax=Nonomuraea jabiensis TaxID=882448 RepID=UPI0034134418